MPSISQYKTISLKTSDINEAKEKAFDHDSDIRFRVRHQVPVFDKSFADVAKEYLCFQKRVADIGQITLHRWRTVDGHIRLHLIPYIGNMQITSITDDKWTEYPFWRKENNTIRKPPKRVLRKKPKAGALPDAKEDGELEKKDRPATSGTIRQEMMTFRAIMNFAAGKHYIRESQVPKGSMPEDKNRRDEFTPQEYRQLHTFARDWIGQADREINIWYRTMAYNFMLIMANTGMRTGEARNLRWRDIDVRTTRDGRPFVTLNVRGKGKYRELIAANNVATYIDRIKAISKATKPDDTVFTTAEGKIAQSLYNKLIADLLTKSGLLYGASGTRRSGYCFRHTYATFRLMEGVDVYFLAKQMGTSVKMIEDYYGHITPAKNAERILQGIPGWDPIADGSSETADSVNAGAAGATPAKPPTK